MSTQEDHSQSSRPTFREQIQNHPIMVLIIASVAVASTTFSVARVLNESKLDNLLAKKDSEISELYKRIVLKEQRIGENNYSDVQKFLVDGSNTRGLSKNAEFVENGRFYAFFDSSQWKYEKETQARKFESDIHGDENKYVRLMRRFPQTGTSVVYVWKGIDQITDNDRPVYKRIFPYVTVEYMTNETFRNLVRRVDRRVGETTSGSHIVEDFLRRHNEYFDLDATGYFLRGIIPSRMLFQQLNPSVKPLSTYIQKGKKILYMHELTEIGPTKTTEKLYDTYYIIEKCLWIIAPKGIYVVNTQIPSSDPSPRPEYNYFAWVEEWLSDFRVLEQGQRQLMAWIKPIIQVLLF